MIPWEYYLQATVHALLKILHAWEGNLLGNHLLVDLKKNTTFDRLTQLLKLDVDMLCVYVSVYM